MSNCRLALGLAVLLGAASAQAAKPIAIEAPPAAESTVCSFHRSICVHGPQASLLRALDSLERGWDAGLILGVPLPMSYSAYIAPEPSRSAISGRDVLSHFDRARTFSVLDSHLAPGCALDFEAARELYAASALASTPSIDDASLRAEATALAELAVPCALVDASAFQSHPDRAVVDRHVGPGYADGASFVFSWLDASFSKQPGRLITSTWALAATHTTSDLDWSDEPDVMDVLRESLKDAMAPGSTIDNALVDLAIARGTSLSPTPHLDWDVAWPTAARTLASPEGLAETGTGFVRIDTKGRRPGARFRIDASWEEHARIAWTVVTLDARDHEVARYRALAAPKAIDAHFQVINLDDVSSILVVAMNLGNWTTPFDPDDDIWEPHGWLLTIAAE